VTGSPIPQYDPEAGTFALGGEMTVGRTDHSATLLNDGTVLIGGGAEYIGGQIALASAELYHPFMLVSAPVLFSLSGDGQGPGAILHSGKRARYKQLFSSRGWRLERSAFIGSTSLCRLMLRRGSAYNAGLAQLRNRTRSDFRHLWGESREKQHSSADRLSDEFGSSGRIRQLLGIWPGPCVKGEGQIDCYGTFCNIARCACFQGFACICGIGEYRQKDDLNWGKVFGDLSRFFETILCWQRDIRYCSW